MLALASPIPSRQIGTGFFQEEHLERLFVECGEYREMISTSEQMQGYCGGGRSRTTDRSRSTW
ncbi:hypothetical protein ACIOC1_35340 [Streptomyces sp. NPDC088197]|uniref:hypothetical protein n=1 Tax=unclassified Streptomyces TaxID=2593676 RepID=UPI0036ED1988